MRGPLESTRPGGHYAAVWELYPGFEVTYCFDPWRNRIELYNREFNRLNINADRLY